MARKVRKNRRHRRRNSSRFGMKPSLLFAGIASVYAAVPRGDLGTSTMVPYTAPSIANIAKASTALEAVVTNFPTLPSATSTGAVSVFADATGIVAFAGLHSDEIATIGRALMKAGAALGDADIAGVASGVVIAAAQTAVLVPELHEFYVQEEIKRFGAKTLEGTATLVDKLRRQVVIEASQAVTNMMYDFLDDLGKDVEMLMTGTVAERPPTESLRKTYTLADVTKKLTDITPLLNNIEKQLTNPGTLTIANLDARYATFMKRYNSVSFFLDRMGDAQLRSQFMNDILADPELQDMLSWDHIQRVLEKIENDPLAAGTYLNKMAGDISDALSASFAINFLVRTDQVNACKSVYSQFTARHVGLGILGESNAALAATATNVVAQVPWALLAGAQAGVAGIERVTGVDTSSVAGYIEAGKQSLTGVAVGARTEAAKKAKGAAYKGWMMTHVATNQQQCMTGAVEYNRWVRKAANELQASSKMSMQPIIEFLEDTALGYDAIRNAAAGEGSAMAQLEGVVEAVAETTVATATRIAETTVAAVARTYETAGAYGAIGTASVLTGMQQLWSGTKRLFDAGTSRVLGTSAFGRSPPTPDEIVQIMLGTGGTARTSKFGQRRRSHRNHRRSRKNRR